MSAFNRFGPRAVLLAGATLLPTTLVAQTVPGDQPTTQATTPDAAPSGESNDDLQDIVVTGQTSRDRPLISASADITYATREDIDRRAPRSTADMLELVPGIFVEATAGEASNNYSVRGLQGGGQRFVQLEEDGMPILYGGGGADFFFQQDLTIDRLEAVKGGSSGVLTVNGAGATINFISKRPNFKEFEGAMRLTGYSYGLKRADFYYSAPLAENLAFNFGGYVQSSPGVRKNPFDYAGYRIKGSLEYRLPSGGSIRLSGRRGDMETAYYASAPYRFDDGDPASIPGFNIQRDNIGGDAFRSIQVPVSTAVDPDGFRQFRYKDGIRSLSNQARLDIDVPLSDTLSIFGRGRYMDYSYDFNGLFPGSGTGNAGLASAVNYLTPDPAVSPVIDLLRAGFAAYPTAQRFGIRNIRTGEVIGSNQTAALNALNGNGFLQRTTLNHDYVDGRDLGINVGTRWEVGTGSIKNSLTVGGMYYNVRRNQDQSATASVVNDVKNNSDIYDIVALDAGNGVVGSLTDSGLVSYGDWGNGIRQRKDESYSLYANDEIAFGDLRIDGGIRWESDTATAFDGNSAAVNQAVQPSVGGVVRNVGSTFNGTFSPTNAGRTGADGKLTQDKISWTVGANYLITPGFAVYARYADGFQTNNIDPITTIELYEAGVRYQYGRLFSGSVTVFRTNFNNQSYNFANPANPTQQQNINADLRTKGVEVDVVVRPVRWFSVDFQGVFQDPKLENLQIDGATQSGFEGNRPERTPARLWTVTPAIQLPNGLGDIYGRYKYVGKIFADAGNGVALPSYGVTSVGVNLNVTQQLQVSFNAENIFDVVGLTEGNPRQGQTQAITDGYFYARGIVGPTYGGSVTFRF
ncbi:TonB-dependent receptor [Microvirga sp. SRT01]|uniref:TonB-dependent receptor n=1 Tax=Sphingomonas longa TaxID=2778730 RepID=A0ABS2DBM8_9SPHN|nr:MULTISPECIES: TonB-dependent receptor [Alphaproteobacteria]MBM6578348.1 TonB-dependent receptor [Sphingomonas sp. BT552]MBR7711389.1 TonB-dependent receptor [Microvirga sp. SRT01]